MRDSASATSLDSFVARGSAALNRLATSTTVRAYLYVLRLTLSCGRKRRSAWRTSFGVAMSNFGRGMCHLVNARHIEVRELGLEPQGIKRFAGDLSVQADCGVGIAEGLDCVVLTAKLFVYPIEAFSPPPGPICLGSL